MSEWTIAAGLWVTAILLLAVWPAAADLVAHRHKPAAARIVVNLALFLACVALILAGISRIAPGETCVAYETRTVDGQQYDVCIEYEEDTP